MHNAHEKSDDPLDELAGSLRKAVEQVRLQQVREEAVQRAIHRAARLPAVAPAIPKPKRLRIAILVGAGIAALILLGVLLSSRFGPSPQEQLAQPSKAEGSARAAKNHAPGRAIRPLAENRQGVDEPRLAPGGKAASFLPARPAPAGMRAPFTPQRPVAVSLAAKLMAYTGRDQPIRPGHKVPLDENTRLREATIHVWDLTKHRELIRLKGDGGWVSALAISPNGKFLASGHAAPPPLEDKEARRKFAAEGVEGTLRLWELPTGKELHKFKAGPGKTKFRGPVMSIAFSPDSKLVGSLEESGDKAFIHVREADSGKLRLRFEGQYAWFPSFAFSPDSKLLAAAYFGKHAEGMAAERQIRLWNIVSGKELRRFPHGHSQTVTCIAMAPDGKTLATGSADGAIRLWDTATGKEVRVFRGSGWNEELAAGRLVVIERVAFSPDGQLVAAQFLAGSFCRAGIWETATGKQRLEFATEPLGVAFLAFLPDGQTLATVGRVTRSDGIGAWPSDGEIR